MEIFEPWNFWQTRLKFWYFWLQMKTRNYWSLFEGSIAPNREENEIKNSSFSFPHYDFQERKQVLRNVLKNFFTSRVCLIRAIWVLLHIPIEQQPWGDWAYNVLELQIFEILPDLYGNCGASGKHVVWVFSPEVEFKGSSHDPARNQAGWKRSPTTTNYYK